MVRKRPAPLQNHASKSTFTKALFSPFFKSSSRLVYEPSDVPSTPSHTSASTRAKSPSGMNTTWVREVWDATDAVACMFGYRNILIRAMQICRCLNAAEGSQQSKEHVEDLKAMFLKGQTDVQTADESDTEGSNASRFVSTKGEFINDDQWIQEAFSSVVTLMGLLARKEIVLNVFGLFELLAMGSRDKTSAEKRKMYLDLVEFELRKRFDVAVLNGSESC